MKFNPLVTVFIPYYNDKDYIRESIESVLNQTYQNFELILLNHASTDGTDEIAHSYKDNRIKHITMKKNLGAGSGKLVKEAVKIAKGEYIKLFCADDILMEDCLETLVNYVEENPDKDVVFTDSLYVNTKGKSMNIKHSQAREFFKFDYSEKELLNFYFNSKSILPYPTNFIKTEVLRKADINETYIMLFDMSLWSTLIINGANFGFIKDATIKYRISSTQISSAAIRNKAFAISDYENSSFYRMFYKIKNIDLLKHLCKYSPYFDMLVPENEEYFHFIVAHYSLLRHEDISSYIYLEQIVSDPVLGKIYEDKFNFGIKELRDLYAKSKKTLSLNINIFKKWCLVIKYPDIYMKKLFVNKYYRKKYTV